MNPQTGVDDVKSLPAGAVCISPVELKLAEIRQDVKHYQVPFAELAAQATENIKLRKLLTNMIYVGIVAELLKIEQEEIDRSIQNQFEGKAKAIELNLNASGIGRQWAAKNLVKQDAFYVERLDKTQGQIIIDGNAACALGSMFAGASVVTWYPITPSSSLCETLIDYLKQYRIDKETGKATFAVVQAEDELAQLAWRWVLDGRG